MEIWEPAAGYEHLYEVSLDGKIRNVVTKRVRRMKLDRDGYRHAAVRICGVWKNIYPHKVVARTYLPRDPDRTQVNHKNGIKSDNRMDNLEWCNASENALHAYRVLGRKSVSGESHGFAILNRQQVRIIKHLRTMRPPRGWQAHAARCFGVTGGAIKSIIRGTSWASV